MTLSDKFSTIRYIAKRADELQEGTWTPPASFQTAAMVVFPAAHLYNTIARGIRTMPVDRARLDGADRCPVLAEAGVLQRKQHACLGDVPPDSCGAIGCGQLVERDGQA